MSLIFGSGYCAKELLFNVEKIATTKRIEKKYHHQKNLPESSLVQIYLSNDFI